MQTHKPKIAKELTKPTRKL